MTLEPFPEHIGAATIPAYLSPSRFRELRQCPLGVFSNPDVVPGALPPSARMLFGSLVHHVREQVLTGRWGSASEADVACVRVLEGASDRLDSLLRSDPRTARLVPLRRAVGRTKWNTRSYELQRWAERLDVKPTGEAPHEFQHTTSSAAGRQDSSDVPRVDTGPEAWVVCPELRLRGRADLIERSADGAIEVSEFKTGTIVDQEDRPKEGYSMQVGLYALAIENVLHPPAVRLYLEGAERVRVPWTVDLAEEHAEELRKVLSELPPNCQQPAEALARPGTWCSGCRLRPACASYLGAAPGWWPNEVGAPRPLPLDVWGTVEAVRTAGAGVTVELVDRSGRSVRIEGLDPDRGVTDLQVGDSAYFFDLAPTEPTIHHGARLQPRNFHELPPDGGLRLKRAGSLQIYRG